MKAKYLVYDPKKLERAQSEGLIQFNKQKKIDIP